MATWDTAYINALPDSSFAWIDAKGGRHLPYKDKNGKVDANHTRNALARLNQVAGLAGEAADKVRTKLQNALKSIGGEQKAAEIYTTTEVEVKANEEGGIVLPSEIEVLQENVWRDMPGRPDFEISASDLDEYADNFKAGVRAGVPINIEHDEDPRFGKQAAGWVKNVTTKIKDNGKKALFVEPDWNNLGKELVGDKRFRFVSAEFVPASLGGQPDKEGKGILKNVLKKVSLTNNPLMKDLPALMASEDSISGLTTQIRPSIIDNKEGAIKVQLDTTRVKEAADLTTEERDFLTEHKSELSAAEVAKFFPQEQHAAEGDDTVTIKASELADLKAKAAKAEQAPALEERMRNLEAAANAGVKASEELAKTKAENLVDKHIKRGAVKADQRDSWVGQLVKASEGSEDHKALVGMLEGLPDNEMLGKTVGDGSSLGGGATKKLIEKAEEMVKASEGSLTFDKALLQARSENTVLASEADAEMAAGEVQ